MHKKCRVSHCAVILCIFYVQNMESYEVIKHTANICFAMAQIFYHKNYPYPQWIDDQQIVSTSSTALRFGRNGASAALPTAMTAMMFSSSGMERSLRMASASRMPMMRVE